MCTFSVHERVQRFHRIYLKQKVHPVHSQQLCNRNCALGWPQHSVFDNCVVAVNYTTTVLDYNLDNGDSSPLTKVSEIFKGTDSLYIRVAI